jgi:MFS family permease
VWANLVRSPVRYYRRVPAPIRVLSIGVLINRVGGFVITFLALILAARHIATVQIGIALALSAVFAMAGAWLGGALISRLGSRQVIFASMAGSAIFTAALVFPSPYPLTVGTVCLISLCNRAYVPGATTIIGRLSRPDQRVEMYAFFQLGFNIGAAIGPALAGYLLTRSLTVLLLIDAATSACFALLGLRVPADAELPSAGEPPPGARRPPGRVRDDRRYLAFCAGVTLVAMTYGQYGGALPLTFRADHYSLALLGYLFSANAIAVIFFQLPLSFVTRKLPAWIPLTVGGLLISGGYALLAAGTSIPLLVSNVALWTMGEMLFNPVTSAVAMASSTTRTHGSYQGALNLARTTGQVVGPSLGVFAYSAAPSLPWWGCGVLGLIAAALFLAFVRTPVPRTAPELATPQGRS